MAQRKPCTRPWEITKTAIHVRLDIFLIVTHAPLSQSLNHLMPSRSPGCSLIHLNCEPQSPCPRPPPAPPRPRPCTRACARAPTHTLAPRSRCASTNNDAATQSARRVCWSSRKGIFFVSPAGFPAAAGISSAAGAPVPALGCSAPPAPAAGQAAFIRLRSRTLILLPNWGLGTLSPNLPVSGWRRLM